MQDSPAHSETRVQGGQAGAPGPSLTKDSLDSCVQWDAQQGRQRRGRGLTGSGRPVWGGKGCGGRGRVCTVTQAGPEAGFEAVTRGGGHVVAAALRNPRGFGAAAGGVSLLKPGFPRGLSVLPATHKGQGWRWGGSPRGPQGMKGGPPWEGWGAGTPKSAGGLAPAGWPGPGLSRQAWEQP